MISSTSLVVRHGNRIRPPRRIARNFLPSATFSTSWAVLERVLREAYRHGGFSDPSVHAQMPDGIVTFEEVYRLAYKAILSDKGTLRLYRELVGFCRGTLGALQRELDSYSDEALLDRFIRISDGYAVVSEMGRDIFMVYNRIIEGEDSVAEEYRSLFLSRWQSILVPSLQPHLRFATWKIVVTDPTSSIIQHDIIREMANSFGVLHSVQSLVGVGAGIRPVYLATRPLNGHLATPASSYPSLHHWGVVVGEDDDDRVLYEVEKVHRGAAVPEWRPFTGQATRGWDITNDPVCYTSLDDESIIRRASTYGMMYQFLSNNCQKFCIRLIECIRMPLHHDDIFQGVQHIPQELGRDVLQRRCRDFERLTLLRRDLARQPRAALPSSIEPIARTSKELLCAILLVVVLRTLKLSMAYLAIVVFYAQSIRDVITEYAASYTNTPRYDSLRAVYRQLYPEEHARNLQRRQIGYSEEVLGMQNRPDASALEGPGCRSDPCPVLDDVPVD